MKHLKTLVFLVCIFSYLTIGGKITYGQSLETYNLETLPIPETFNTVSSKIDITEHPIYPIIKDFENSILSHIDPLSFEREFTDRVPEYDFIQFNTEMQPQDIFEFYQEFYKNLDGGKSYSEVHFDTSAGDSPSMCKNNEIAYYTIKIGTSIGPEELYFSISAFKDAPDNQTDVYIFTYKKTQ